MKISEQIDQIIAARHRHLPGIEQKIKELDEIEACIDQLEHVKNQMISPDGDIIEGGAYAALLAQNPDMAWNLQGLDTDGIHVVIGRARKELEECRHRFGRESISLSVIGEARKGKSKVLQAISGLDDLVIPAYESTDCTGASSIIYNEQDGGLKAVVRFKSKRQVMDMAQFYLNTLIPNPADQIAVNSIEQIRTLNMENILRKVPMGHPGRIVQNYLRKMIDHYDEWAPYAGQTEPLILTRKEEIACFVAQNNGIGEGELGREEYHKYLVVEGCEIYCRFPETETGKINLVDTVGINDHTAGIQEGMLRAVEKESDAVIFMIMPQNGAGGGIPKPVSGIYEQIVEKCGNRNLDKWLFYLINHVEHTSGSYGENTQHCNSAKRVIKENGFFGCEHTWIINALDQRAVREDFLLPVLMELSKNLTELDQTYLSQANEVLKSLRAEYAQLCRKAQKVLGSDFAHNTTLFPLINEKTEISRKELRSSLFRLKKEWGDKKTQPCPELYEAAAEILDRMRQDYREDSYIPPKVDVLDLLESGVQPHQVYIDYENKIRNQVSKDFLKVDVELRNFVDRMKDQVADILCSQCGFSVILRPDENRPMREWLKDFSDSVLDDNSYPNIKLAVDTLYHFDFSVKGFMSYEVQDGLSGLDPDFSNLPAIVNSQNSLSRTAGNIRSHLMGRICVIADELDSRLGQLFCKPNMALFAEVSELYDRMIYSERVDMEWRNFYAEKAGVLWASDLRQKQAAGVLCQEWMDLVEALVKKSVASNFMITG